MEPPVLEAERISKHFGGVAALREASFELRRGEVHALIGENGAGKSTLAKILAGAVTANSGRILVDGQPAAISGPADAQRLGIGIIHQELDLFPHLTVGENLVAGNLRFHESSVVSWRRMEEFCRPFLTQAGLSCGVRQELGALPIGQQQLVAIARALSMEARVILMDEPTSSLFDDAVDRLFGLIAGLQARGVSIVYVSHKMDELFRICGRATVLRDGRSVATLEMAAASPQEIIRLMVGRDVMMGARPYRRSMDEVVLKVDDLTTGKLRGVSFELHRSEVLGVAGLVGAGRTELGSALFGIDRIRGGRIQLQGRDYAPASTREAIGRGMGLAPEDRRVDGLMMNLSITENCTLAVLERMERWGFVRRARERDALAPLAERLRLNCPSPSAPVSTLSGGNQQKVLLARWLLVNPDVLFLDDPTRGIDVGAKQDIYRIIDELAAAGKGVILVSSELPELLRCSDRILVLCEGRVTALHDARGATQERIMAAATRFAAPLGDSA